MAVYPLFPDKASHPRAAGAVKGASREKKAEVFTRALASRTSNPGYVLKGTAAMVKNAPDNKPQLRKAVNKRINSKYGVSFS